jgi:hypothetical protein
MNNMNPNAIFFVAFCTILTHWCGWGWEPGAAFSTGIVFVASLELSKLLFEKRKN